MSKKSLIVMLLSGLLILAFLAACSGPKTIYICANGKAVEDNKSCMFNKVAGVKKLEAEAYAKNFVNAYFLPYGGKSQMVSSYLDPDKGDYFATFIVANKDSEPYQTEVLIDGITGKVNCTTNCQYIK